MNKTVCFIGHRNVWQNIDDRLNKAIQEEIDNGCRLFIMGTHGEFDSKVLSACKQFREKYKDIKIQVAITSFQKIKKQVIKDEIFGDEVYVPYDDVETIMFNIEEEHFKKQITVSNRQMIDLCDTLICFVDKTRNPSGAKTAMNYAKRKGLKIINLYREEDEPTYGMTKEEKKKYYNELIFNLMHSKQ